MSEQIIRLEQVRNDANVLLTNILANTTNSVAVYANGTLILSGATLNYNNTSTVNVSVQANGSLQANISFSVNTSSVGGSGGSSPAGSNTWLQYNNNGVLGATANLTYNVVTNTLTSNANVNINSNVTAKGIVTTGSPNTIYQIDFTNNGTHANEFNMANNTTIQLPSQAGMVLSYVDLTTADGMAVILWKYGTQPIITQYYSSVFSNVANQLGTVNCYFGNGTNGDTSYNYQFNIQNLTTNEQTIALSLFRLVT